MEGCEIVVHLAGRAHVTGDDSAEKYRVANEVVTQRISSAAVQNGVTRFVYLSSIKVNGESSSSNQPIRHTNNPSPLDNYGRSKMAAEISLQSICRASKMDYVIIRPTLVYGKGVKANFSLLAFIFSFKYVQKHTQRTACVYNHYCRQNGTFSF